MKKSQSAFYTYLLFSITYLIVILLDCEHESKYLKPLLIPILIFALQRSKLFKTKKMLFSALIFCWIGDCVLLFADQEELYFIVGLISFLMAHVIFIVLFSKQTKTAVDYLKLRPFWIGTGLSLAFLFGLLFLLVPKLGSLTIPVILYGITITLMLIEALKGAFSWEKREKYIVLTGAVLFVLSDSILAIDKFYDTIPLATFWIMLTYLAAQFCIVFGIIKLNQKKVALH